MQEILYCHMLFKGFGSLFLATVPFHPFHELALLVSDSRSVVGLASKKVSKYERQDIRDKDKKRFQTNMNQIWGKYETNMRKIWNKCDKAKKIYETNWVRKSPLPVISTLWACPTPGNLLTNIFRNLDKYILHFWTNASCNLDILKYIC